MVSIRHLKKIESTLVTIDITVDLFCTMQIKQEVKGKGKLIKSNITNEGMNIIKITYQKWETQHKQTNSLREEY